WANPPGVCLDPGPGPNCEGMDQSPYLGPVPMIVHVHGAKTHEYSDGFPEAWYLPAATDIPASIPFRIGSSYPTFRSESPFGALWSPGPAVFDYPNAQRATTLWYHDHSLGMTRQNVYAGPAGFYVLRGGPQDLPPGRLPGPAPMLGDAPATRYHEIPIVI